MNQLSSIKERLNNFNETEFQELCDCFLSLRNRGYKAYSRTGAHDIKQKTTRGTPDSFFQMPNGLYLFIESTTTEHKGKKLINKLKSDISGCFNVDETKIPVSKIQEIILCYNSNLKPVELEEINKEAMEKMGKPPMHYSLDSLATEIFFHHKNIAHDYLNLPLDTGQVVSLNKFVEEYDNGKQKLATPLAGVFLHRDSELKEVRDKLAEGDIVIISGPAGVGKTKMALEAIKQFIASNLDYNAYAISTKGADLLGDLSAYFDGENNGILLVDDVNRVDKFEQILGFYRGLMPSKLKLILTVRDYALENVREWLSTYENSFVEIGGFSFEEIKAIIEKEPFGIRNGKYQIKINSISNGNARLAVMMAIIARKTNKLDSLNNVSDLFEQYFETFVSDEDAFKDKRVLKALGIISFFYTLPYNDSELLNSVAKSFLISSDELRESFDKLHSLDLIQLNYEHVRIGEQNLSTYFFYKVFIKDQLLSFESLWNNYFKRQEHRFKDTIYSIYESFGKKYITVKIRPVLLSYWSTIQSDEDKAFRFLNFAWEFLPDECLAYLEERIDTFAPSNVLELNTKYENNDFASTYRREKHLNLLAIFLKEPIYYLDALEFSFQLVELNSQHLPQLIYHIDQNVYFIDTDYINHFERQTILVDYLVGIAEKGRLHALAFFEVSRSLLIRLNWNYKNKKEAEEEDGPNITSVKRIRGIILNTLCKLYKNYTDEVFDVILDYSLGYKKYNKYTLEYDLVYLIPWIDNNLKRTDFRHCYFVRELIRFSTTEKFKHDDFKRLKLTFVHPSYSLYELVNWDRRRGKEDYDFDDHREFEKLKIADISKKLVFKSKDEINQFIIQYQEILEWDRMRLHFQQNVVVAILRTNLNINNEIGFAAFIELVRLCDKGRFNSDLFISNSSIDSMTIYPKLAERFWKAIESEGLKEIWKMEVLTSLPIESITNEHLSRLYKVLNELQSNYWIQIERLKKYEKVDSRILANTLNIVVEKIEKENLKIFLWKDFFIQLSSMNVDIRLLKYGYIQQDELIDHFDYDGKALVAIIQKDNSFLLEYIKSIFERDRQGKAREHKELAMVWELPNAEKLLDEVIKYMTTIEDQYSFSEHFVNAFFQKLTYSEERADKFLLSIIERYSYQLKIVSIVFDIIHNSRKDLFEEAFEDYIKLNQKVECFKEICWTHSQAAYSGNAIVGAIKAAKWEKLLRMVENAKLGTKTRAIRKFIRSERDFQLRYAEGEKRRKFLFRF